MPCRQPIVKPCGGDPRTVSWPAASPRTRESHPDRNGRAVVPSTGMSQADRAMSKKTRPKFANDTTGPPNAGPRCRNAATAGENAAPRVLASNGRTRQATCPKPARGFDDMLMRRSGQATGRRSGLEIGLSQFSDQSLHTGRCIVRAIVDQSHGRPIPGPVEIRCRLQDLLQQGTFIATDDLDNDVRERRNEREHRLRPLKRSVSARAPSIRRRVHGNQRAGSPLARCSTSPHAPTTLASASRRGASMRPMESRRRILCNVPGPSWRNRPTLYKPQLLLLHNMGPVNDDSAGGHLARARFRGLCLTSGVHLMLHHRALRCIQGVTAQALRGKRRAIMRADGGGGRDWPAARSRSPSR